ncbi:TIGR03619 family F420-dependent LLM class oxidoreductase [Angustibacter speluncae]
MSSPAPSSAPAGLPLLGFGLPVSGGWATPDTLRHVASRADALGWASVWTFQRVLHPVAADLPPTHRSVQDPLVPLAFAAAVTERVRLGTATVCALLTSPVLLAKQLATLDVLSRGRLTVGLGTGWLPEEFAATGLPLSGRGERMDEFLRCLVALWTTDPVAFDGRHWRVPSSSSLPHPVQRPHPPVLVGGTSAAAQRRAGRLAQGWVAASTHDLEAVRAGAQVVRSSAEAAGRDPDAVQVLVRRVVDLLDRPPPGARPPFRGTREQVRDDLAALRTAGATEVLLDLNLHPDVGDPDADPAAALARADEVLEAFAPGPG